MVNCEGDKFDAWLTEKLAAFIERIFHRVELRSNQWLIKRTYDECEAMREALIAERQALKDTRVMLTCAQERADFLRELAETQTRKALEARAHRRVSDERVRAEMAVLLGKE